MRFQTARLLLSRRARRRHVDVTCSGGPCVMLMRCNTGRLSPTTLDPSAIDQQSQTVTSADALPTSHFPSYFLLSPCSAEGLPCSLASSPDQWCHHPSGPGAASHLTARHLQRLSLSYSGRADIHSCTFVFALIIVLRRTSAR